MIVIGVPVALGLVPSWLFIPFLLASSLGRRFVSTAAHVVVDREGLSIDEKLVAPRSAIGDVWLDDDEREPRVVVTHGERLFVLWFPNRGQAERCAKALGDPRVFVAGHLPRLIDLLASLRFVSIALPFILAKNLLALLVLVVAAPGVLAFLRGQQVIARDGDVTIKTWRGATTIPYPEIESVDDEGELRLRNGRSIAIPRSAIRDALLAAPAWTGRAHARVMKRIARFAK